MSLLDVILGRSRAVKSKLERLFAMSTASVTLTTELGLEPSGRAGVCFRPLTSSLFEAAEAEVRALLKTGGEAARTAFEVQRDNHGFDWVVLTDPDIEDLVATIHMVSLTLQEQGFGEQLLAAVFKFLERGRPVFWIYNYKRGSFYPQVAIEGERRRDNAAELRLRALLEKELPIEKDLQRWYPLWDIPL